MEHINISFWIIQTLAMMITAFLLPGLSVSGPLGALAAVIGLAFMNAHLWDAALFFSIPDTFTIHTLTLLVANGLLFWILVKVLPGIEISGCLPALVAPVIFTFLSIFLQNYAKDVDWKNVWKQGVAIVESAKDELKGSNKP